jgi:hypothetical protein
MNPVAVLGIVCTMNTCELAIAKMENGEHIKDKNYRTDGIISWTKVGSQKREWHQEVVIDVILDKQFAQWNDGVDDDETIAELYGAQISHFKIVAMTKGLMMEWEVQEYLVSTMENYDSIITLSTQSVPSLLSPTKSTCLLLLMRSSSLVASTKSTVTTNSSKSSKSSKPSKSNKSKSSNSTTTGPTKTKNKLGRAQKSPTKTWSQKSNDEASHHCCRSV